ncbi:MAG: hypothetical protein F4X48_01455, partial [Acidimicrobiia bacterium]|nr:hypothetical protein [Acidimicrobiia bacterium]
RQLLGPPPAPPPTAPVPPKTPPPPPPPNTQKTPPPPDSRKPGDYVSTYRTILSPVPQLSPVTIPPKAQHSSPAMSH